MVNRDAHENLLHVLSALLIELQALQKSFASDARDFDGETLRAGLRDMEELARTALSLVRDVLDELPLPALEHTSLPEALSALVEETAEHLGAASRVSFSGLDEQKMPRERALAVPLERLLFLVVRELLCQIEQRARTRRLRFSLNYYQSEVQIILEDEWSSSVATASTSPDEDVPLSAFRLPPSALEEIRTPILADFQARLLYYGGSLEVSSADELRTRFIVTLPYVIPLSLPGQNDGSNTQKADNEMIPLRPSPGSSGSAVQPFDTRIAVLVVDNQAVIRAGLQRLLETYADLRVIGSANDGVQAVSETLELGPQVVLMDAQLPDGQTLEALKQIKQLNPDIKVLLLATQEREEYLYEALRAGADGYILKDVDPDELAQAVRSVARGELRLNKQIAGRLFSRFERQGRNENRYDTLTARELDVLRLLARGLRNKEIAARLSVSERTINFHLANIYQKLSVSGRTEALSRAIEQGLVSPLSSEHSSI